MHFPFYLSFCCQNKQLLHCSHWDGRLGHRPRQSCSTDWERWWGGWDVFHQYADPNESQVVTNEVAVQAVCMKIMPHMHVRNELLRFVGPFGDVMCRQMLNSLNYKPAASLWSQPNFKSSPKDCITRDQSAQLQIHAITELNKRKKSQKAGRLLLVCIFRSGDHFGKVSVCLLYTSDAADDC